MPRDSTETRERLEVEGERLFADVGIWRVQVREIVAAAGQRNTSAVTYHFGSRDGLLSRILTHHGEPIDGHRGQLLADLDTGASTRSVIEALVTPMTRCLDEERGRRYVRIVAQLSDRFSDWRSTPADLVAPNLTQALDMLERRPEHLREALRRERLVAMMQLMTSSLAERGRVLDSRSSPGLDARLYRENLVDMLVGLLEAPTSAAA